MIITLNKVFPIPMSDVIFDNTSLWHQEIMLDGNQNNMVCSASGKGKSSLMAFLAGLRSDYGGEILFDGVEIRRYSTDQWSKIRREKLAFLHQELQLIPHFTAWENLMLKHHLIPVISSSEIEQMMDELGILNYRNQKTSTLSLGQRQRLAIIRCLLQPYSVLLMDEPFSHLDDKNIEIAVNLITRTTSKNNAGMILASLGNHYNINFDKTLYL